MIIVADVLLYSPVYHFQMILLYQQLEEERQKVKGLQKENGALRAENAALQQKIADGKKKPIPNPTKAEVRHCYKNIVSRDRTEFDLNVSVDHPDNKSIIDRVVNNTQARRDITVDIHDARRAAKAMFINLRDDRNRVLNGKKSSQLKGVRRRNRMVQKVKSRKMAFNSTHCKLTEQQKEKAKIMFSEKMEYISSDEDTLETESTPEGLKTIRTVRILPFESSELKGYKQSLDKTYRMDLTPESRKSHLTVLKRDPSVSPMSMRPCPPSAPHWAVITLD